MTAFTIDLSSMYWADEMYRLVIAVACLCTASGCGAAYRIHVVRNDLHLAASLHQHELAVKLAAENLRLNAETHGVESIEYRNALRRQATVMAEADFGDTATEVLKQTLVLDDRLYEPLHPEKTYGLHSLAYFQIGMGRPHLGAEPLEAAVGICERLDATQRTDWPCGSTAEWQFAGSFRQMGNYERAEQLLLSSNARASVFVNAELEISGLASLGDFYVEYGNLPKANWYYERSKRLWEVLHASPEPRSGKTIYRDRDVSIDIQAIAHGFPNVAPRCTENMTWLSERLGRFPEAETLRIEEKRRWAEAPRMEKGLLEAIAYEEKTWASPPRLSWQRQALGFYRYRKGDLAGAIEAYERGMQDAEREWAMQSLFERHFPKELLLDGRLVLGDLYMEARRFEDAERQYRLFLDDVDRFFNSRHRWRLEGRARLALLHLRAGRHDRSEATWQDYLNVAQTIRGKDHAEYAWGLHGLAETKSASNEINEAQKLKASARAIWNDYERSMAAVKDLPLPATLKPFESLIK